MLDAPGSASPPNQQDDATHKDEDKQESRDPLASERHTGTPFGDEGCMMLDLASPAPQSRLR
jgi:hypothetical protein